MMRFDKVFIGINGKKQSFNFKRVDEDEGGIWILSSGSRKLYVDDEFNFENSGMPVHWVGPVMSEFKKLLADSA